MGKVLLITIVVILPLQLFSQLLSENTLLLNKENKTRVGIEFNGEANSTSISNSALSRLYRPKQTLTRDDLQTTVDKLNKTNYAGANIWGRVFYQKRLWRRPIQYYRISFEYIDLVSAKFSGDLLGLATLGNKAFEDKTAKFDKVNFTNYNAQKISFHIGKKLDKNTKIDAGISFLKGGRYQKGTTKKGSLYTAPYGEFLEGDLDFTYSSTPKKKAYNFLGYGLSTDIHWSHILKDTSLLTVGVNDLGIMNWTNVQTLSLDTSFFFEGLVIDNIFDTINLNTKNISPDSIQSIVGVKNKTRDKLIITPFTLFANYRRKMGDKIVLSIGAQYTYGTSLLPVFTTIFNYKIKDGFSIYPILSYGGFGSYNVGFGINKALNEKVDLRLQSRFLDGLVRYSSKGGQGVFLSLFYKL